MISNNENPNFEQSRQGANNPINAKKIKEYGKKAYTPLLNVITKYQDEFTPYLNALSKGLQGGVNVLSKEDSDGPEKYIAQFFREAAEGLNHVSEKMKSKDINALSTYISDLGARKPSLMFGTSYIAGLFFGRLAKHIISQGKNRIPPEMMNKDESLMSDDINERGQGFSGDQATKTTDASSQNNQSIH